MRELVRDLLWLGNAKDARDLRGLLDLGISAVIDLTIENTPPMLTRDLVYCRFPLVDGQGNSPEVLTAAVETLISLLSKRQRTLVYCGAGMSRSPCIAAMALALRDGKPPDETLQNVLSGHPSDVSPALWDDIKRACARLPG